jgi:hypothetical protein
MCLVTVPRVYLDVRDEPAFWLAIQASRDLAVLRASVGRCIEA